MEITFDKDPQTLAKIIDARRKELGETTKQACVAIALNILRSLRVQTKVAKENQMDISVVLADDKYYPSFRRPSGSKGKNISERVLRQGPNGPVINPDKVIWHIGKYYKGQIAHSFEVEDKVSKDKIIKYIIVAETSKQAQKYAKEFHRRRVKKYKSLAKHAVGIAMKAVYDKGNVNDNVSQAARQLAAQVVNVSVHDSGFNSGDVSINVHDNLNYAALALKAGPTSVQTAIQNAVNKIVGLIEQKVKRNGGSIDQSLKIPMNNLVGDES